MEEKKLNKKDLYGLVKDIVAESNDENKEMLIEFLDTQIAQLEAKLEKARKRAAEKRAKGDELREVVQAVLTDEFQTIDEITSQVEGEEITKAKVTARLTSLVKAGLAEKTEVTGEDKRKLKAYKLV